MPIVVDEPPGDPQALAVGRVEANRIEKLRMNVVFGRSRRRKDPACGDEPEE